MKLKILLTTILFQFNFNSYSQLTLKNNLELLKNKNWVWQVIKLDDNFIDSSSEDGSIKIWNCDIEKSINTFYENVPIISLSFNNKSRQLITGNLNGEISIRTLTNDFLQHEIKSFKAHIGIIRTIKFTGDKHIATGGEDNKFKIWNLNGQLVSELKHQNFVQSIELLDSKTLMSASYDGTIITWTI